MALTGTIVAHLICNTTKFNAPMKKAERDVLTLEKRLKSLQNSAKNIGGFLVGEKLRSFIKGSLTDALKQGSDLQQTLGVRGVEAAEQLAQSIGKIKLGLQSAVIEVLSKFIPALELASSIAENLSRRIGGGGLTKVGAEVAAERKGMWGKSTAAIDSLNALLAQRTKLERAPLVEGWEWVYKSEVQQRAAIRQAQLESITKDIAVTRVAAHREAWMNLLKSGFGSRFIAESAGADLFKGGRFAFGSVVGNRGEHLLATLFGNRGNSLFAFNRSLSNAAGTVGQAFSGLGQSARFIGGNLASPLGPLGFLSNTIQARLKFLGSGPLEKFDSPIANLVEQLREEQLDPARLRPGAFERGREDTLEEIFRIMQADRAESGEDLPDLIKVAKDQLAEQQRMAQNIARALKGQLPVPARF